MSVNEKGRMGECMARIFLSGKGCKLFQPDWIALTRKDEYILIETKYQEAFTPPPFAGHGLPLRQINARLAFQSRTNIRAMLVVLDPKEECWYWQFIDVLEKGKHLDTGIRKRRIYPLSNFNKEPANIQELIKVAKDIRDE